MENLESQLNKIKEISLDKNVKDNILLKVLDFIHQNPKLDRKMVSPFIGWTEIFYHRQLIGSLALIVLLFSVPVSAKQALPNNFLYPIKINITEPLVTFLTSTKTNPDARSLELASERLEEAVTLASRNELTPEIEQILINNLSKNISTFKITRLKDSTSQSQSANYAISEDSALPTFENQDNTRSIEKIEPENSSGDTAILMMSSAPALENTPAQKEVPPATTTDNLPVENTEVMKNIDEPDKINTVNPRLQDLANTLNVYREELQEQDKVNRNNYKLLKVLNKELEDLNSI